MGLNLKTSRSFARSKILRKTPLRTSMVFLFSFFALGALGNNGVYGAEFFCTSGDVTCLTAAINEANETDEEDTINLEAGIYSITTPMVDRYALLLRNVTLNGESAENTVIERDPNATGFFGILGTGGNVTLNSLTIRGAVRPVRSPIATPGGITNGGVLTVNQSIITDNSGDLGGGIVNFGTLDVIDSIVTRNLADRGAGIINLNGSRVNILRSTISHNGAEGAGGIENNGDATIQDSTISHNTAFGPGGIGNTGTMTLVNTTVANNRGHSTHVGGIANVSGMLKIVNSTISGNQGYAVSGGIANHESGTLELQNTVLAGNFLLSARLPSDCSGAIKSLANNVVGDPTGCDITLQPSDLTGDPGLADFIDDGTPGNGHFPLLNSSPAIDAGNNDVCLSDPVLATDQIGNPRVGVCDIGAIEFQPEVAVLTVAVDIRPGSPNNNINPNSNALIPVAILSTSGFDTNTVDQSSVRFGPNQASAEGTRRFRDVDHDGLPDLILQFRIQNSGIQCGDSSVAITGQSVTGMPIQGSDSIHTVGCKPTQNRKK